MIMSWLKNFLIFSDKVVKDLTCQEGMHW